MNGYGIYIGADGQKYEGQFVNDKREGHGIFTWTDGQVYKGEFQNNHKHGRGVHFFQDGTKKIGQFENGKLLFWIKKLDKDCDHEKIEKDVKFL